MIIMSNSITRIAPESIVPWDNEEGLIAPLLGKRGGDWVVAVAFLDYGNLGNTTAPLRLAFGRKQHPLGEQLGAGLLIEAMARVKEDSDLLDEVEDEARRTVELIPPKQRADTAKLGREFLGETTGHYAVSALVEALEETVGMPSLSLTGSRNS